MSEDNVAVPAPAWVEFGLFPLVAILTALAGHAGICFMHRRGSSLRIAGLGNDAWLWLLAPVVALLCHVVLVRKTVARVYVLRFTGLISLCGALFAMAVHTGDRTAVSPTSHLAYVLGLLGSVGMVVAADVIRDRLSGTTPPRDAA